ncbi:MAG TPA: Gmad2 immunoglobulin-like domain-containing protein [Mycobacteriales bacterium]|nr:Gmad2 immunoglobulin-like domain-containing protein [Mycobacteriales bacterium]
MPISRRRSAAAGLAALVLLTGCGEDEPESADAAAGTSPPRVTGSSKATTPTKKPAGTTKKPAAATTAPVATAIPDDATVAAPGTMTTVVYYVVDEAELGPRLAREFRRVPRSTGVVRAAVDAMLHLAPLDPDYTSPWPKSAKVLGASIKDDTATIDLSAGSMSNLTNLGSAFETAAQQQLIWTVTAVAPTVQRVRLTVARKTPGSGHVDWSAPQRRAKHHDILVPVQISSPGHGAKVRRRLTVTGEATVFEASVSWAVVDVASRKVLDKGFVTASAGAPSRGTWKFTAQLPASAARRNVEIRAWEASAKDGRVTHLDSKVVTVG